MEEDTIKREAMNSCVNAAFDYDTIEVATSKENGYTNSTNTNEVHSTNLGVIGDIEKDAATTPERGQWNNGVEFLMSCIAMSVGLGNIWRFPFTAYENGGGAFLIPYIIMLLLIGRPVYYLEMCLGQFTSRANVKTFEALAPCLKGIGYGQMIGSIYVATYYCSLMAITLFYFLNSFTSDLPWATCREEWIENGVQCIPSKDIVNKSELTASAISSSELYFKKEVLHQYPDLTNGIGLPEWRLTLCLLASWIPTFVVSMNGVQSSGRAAYFLAIFPYVIMIALLVRAVTLEGAAEGIMYFISPNWSALTEAKVWYSAVTQCFFSLNIGFGSLIMYSSYNDFHHNIYRDSMIVSFMDTFTSVLAGTTIFGILGHLAYKQNVEVSDVINAGGTGLAFISYPEAIAKFDSVPWIFALLFFAMLFILGVGSLIALQGSSFTVITDHFPHWKKWHVSLGCATGGFLIGLMYCTPGGQFMVTLVDYYSGSFIFFIMIMVEVFALFWWYGMENFCDDVEFMLKRRVGWYWRFTWGVITPVVLVAIFIYFMATITRLKHEGIDYPDRFIALGWCLLGFALIQILGWWLFYILHKRAMGTKPYYAVKKSISHVNWGPRQPRKYTEWIEYKRLLRERRARAKATGLKRLYYVLTGKIYY